MTEDEYLDAIPLGSIQELIEKSIYTESSDDFIHTQDGWCYWTTKSNPMVYGLQIDPSCRRKGNAAAILAMVISEIRRSGYAGEITIQALPHDCDVSKDDLVAFYCRMGLTVMPDPCA